ncbi:unnamed protein product [Diabrotica balteata]|uniref:Uncharacterized protein n=1 Tax=Diabrotica balteata TaxID=107213 RepID=A0A9N9XED1_DIABA|nr:unnamed protein product [Diabrotica balteata]
MSGNRFLRELEALEADEDFDNYIPRYDNIPNFSHPNLTHQHNETHVLPVSSHNDNFFDTFTQDDNLINTFTDIPVIFTKTPFIVHVSSTEAIDLSPGEEQKDQEIDIDVVSTTPNGTYVTDILTSSVNDIEFNSDQEYPSIIVTNVSDYGKNGSIILNEEAKSTKNMGNIETTTGRDLTEATLLIVNKENKSTEDIAKIETTTGRYLTEATSVIENKESKSTENTVKLETTTDSNIKETTTVISNKESKGTENITKIETTTISQYHETTSTHVETTERIVVSLSATFNISEVESSVNETTRNPREETEKDDPEFAEKESQESDESSEEDDEDMNMVTGILSALLGGLSKPDGGIDLDAIVGLIGSLSTQNDDGSYDFSGLTELLKGFFGGGGDGGGGSDIGAFAGGLLGAVIKGIADPPGGKGVGVLTAKLLSGILPALSVQGFNPVQFVISTVTSLSNSKPKGKPSKKE